MKTKEILLVGNTGYVTEAFIGKAFPECHVMVMGNPGIHSDKKKGITSFSARLGGKELQEVFQAYEFDSVIYFSNYLTFHGELEGEMERLRRMLQNSRAYGSTRILYLTGPEGAYSVSTGKTVLADSAEQLCMHYAEIGHLQIKVVRLPYLYSGSCPSDYFFRQFQCMEQKGRLEFTENPGQKMYFLCMDDLAELLYRMLDGWSRENEILNVPDCFSIPCERLGEEMEKQNPGVRISYGADGVCQEVPADDKVLRHRYGWFPKISVLNELPLLYQEYRAVSERKATRWQRLVSGMKEQGRLWRTAELGIGFLLAELLRGLMGGQVQFRMIDIRLLFIVMMGTIYGMDMGIWAAALESASLAWSYQRQGTNWFTLFYEPGNWLPFLLYFMTGAVCGYVQLKNREDVAFTRKEKSLITEKFLFLRNLYLDALQDKKEYKKQIIGSRDSFGKIFDITRQLDVVRPQEIFLKIIQIFEAVMENQTISIYSLGQNQSFARLEAASKSIALKLPKSLRMEDCREALGRLEEGEVWSNNQLLKGYPMYMAGVRKDSRLVLLLVIQEADYSQMTLYYLNLFKILCGLVQTSLLRALDYQSALRGQQYIEGTNILKEFYFLERLKLQHSMMEQKIAEYMLVRLDLLGKTLEEADDILSSKIRENDVLGMSEDGSLYLILTQTAPEYVPIVTKRLEEAGFGCRVVEQIQPDED
ncbi:MAG: NAD(P)-dependent oxidoreductase [Lachnospiraceae bacterium]|nr:NAD(P)-dependent oxidoreductase [Lachnospiraceae bacterium]